MEPDTFRRLALQLPETTESAHMNHPDFRAAGKIFATLGYPDASWGMVKLNAEQQREFIQLSPSTFSPVPGGWGRQGSTRVHLESADEPLLCEALTIAWRNAKAKPASKRKPGSARS